jgi:branched-chain amino acid transport system permease protein
MFELIINIILNSIFYAGILFIISAGLQIIYGVLGIINFAHAGAYMLGLYMTFSIMNRIIAAHPLLLWTAPIFAAVVVGLFGLIFERVILRFMYHRDPIFQILVTFGMVYIVDDVVRYTWGGYPVGAPPMISSVLEIGGTVYPVYNLLIIGVAFFVSFSLWLLFQKTDIGRLIRATSHDEEMTKALGINVSWVKAGTFLFGSAIAGLAGGLMLSVTGGWPGVGLEYLIMAFVVIALAGLGSVNGALITALIIGAVNSIGIQFFPRIELAIMFILMAVILTVRPSGLFGTPHH